MITTPIRVTGSRVLVLPELPPQISGGVHLPQSHVNPATTGLVIAVSATASRRTPDLQKGQRVLFKPHLGANVYLDGYKLRLLDHQDVLGIIAG